MKVRTFATTRPSTKNDAANSIPPMTTAATMRCGLHVKERPMYLGELIAGLNIRRPSGAVVASYDARVCDVTEDSRTVQPGSLYIARRGETSDGREFVQAAVAAGAVAILSDDPSLVVHHDARTAAPVPMLVADDVPLASALLGERFYGNPSSKLALIGVTGTNGKTTTTYLIHQILNSLGIRCGLIGTVCIDDGTEVAPASMTTPPALEISRTLARMLEAGCRAAVLEVSSHSLAQKRVAAIQFDVGVFTNLTGDHLDYHKTMETYADTKAMLLAMLPPASGTAIVNMDDPAWRRMARDCSARVVGTSMGRMSKDRTSRTEMQRQSALAESNAESHAMHGSLCTATTRRSTRFATDADLTTPWTGKTVHHLHVPMVGPHNVMNSVQAVASVLALTDGSLAKLADFIESGEISPTQVLAALARTSAPPGRMECLTEPGDAITVYVDYAHSDDALRTVLGLLRNAIDAEADHPGRGKGAGPKGAASTNPPEKHRSPALAVVFGCGGDRDAAKRPRMGKVASELADRVYVTSDNPRTEDPMSIINAVVAGMPVQSGEKVATDRVVIEPDREKAIFRAIREARAGDVVIIAGKGHEDYQILPAPPPPPSPAHPDREDEPPPVHAKATIKRFFDDRLAAGEALKLRGIQGRSPMVVGAI